MLNLRLIFLIYLFATLPQFPKAQSLSTTGQNIMFLNPGTLLMYGGLDSTNNIPLDTHYLYNSDTASWNEVKVNGDIPNPRYKATTTQLKKNRWILFGGTDGIQVFNDFFAYDASTSTWTRSTSVEHHGHVGRWNHAATTDGSGFLFVFGGLDQEGHQLGDLLIVSLSSDTFWNRGEDLSISIQKGPQSDANQFSHPSPRSGHSMTLIENKIYVFGGFTKTTSECAELYTLEHKGSGIVVWTFIPSTPPCPSPREGHVALRDGQSLLIIGGCHISNLTPKCYNDLWNFNIVSHQWTKVSDTFSPSFEPRMGHSASFLQQKQILITGGTNEHSTALPYNTILSRSSSCIQGCAQPHGTCDEKEQCICNSGFFGYDCNDAETNPLLSHSERCNNHGFPELNGECNCFLGYNGPNCEFGVNKCPKDCSGFGFCNAKSQCECHAGYSGVDCSVFSSCPLGCCNKGVCDESGKCSCDASYYGATCSVTAEQIHSLQTLISEKREILQRSLASTENTLKQLEHNRLSMESSVLKDKRIVEMEFEKTLNDKKNMLLEKLSQIPVDATESFLATNFFNENHCSASVTDTLHSIDFLPEVMNSPPAEFNKQQIFSGDTSYEQNELAIEKSRINGRQDHILPPGPNNIAIEDLFSLAMNDEFLNQQKIAEKSQHPLQPHQNTLNKPLKSNALPAYPMATTSIAFRLVMFCFFLCVGTASTYAVHYINTLITDNLSKDSLLTKNSYVLL